MPPAIEHRQSSSLTFSTGSAQKKKKGHTRAQIAAARGSGCSNFMEMFRKCRKPGSGRLILERVENRVLLGADPVAAVATPEESLINEDFGFTVSFEHTGADWVSDEPAANRDEI